jgi:osmotically-inducible protein OsmY
MMKKIIFRAAMILMVLIISSTGLMAKSQITDKKITDAVEDELWLDKAVPSYTIDVVTVDGIVTLSGTVDNILAKERATRIADIVKGVRSVVNDIKVTPPALRRDSQIKRDVKAALMTDPATDLYEVGITVDNNIVTLTGAVDSWQERRLCETVVKGVKGVKGVDNRIIVDWPNKERSDSEIKQEIKKTLDWDAFVNNALIDVTVKNAKVKLTGTVGSAAEKNQAMLDAYVTGVQSVDTTQLEVNSSIKDKDLRGSKYVNKSEKEIQAAIKEALLFDPRVSSFRIVPDVEGATVTLRGTVDNLKAKHAAERDARNTVGVRSVNNRIKVRPNEQPKDKDIENMVEKALRRDPYVESYEITVNSINGVVDLYGKVDTIFEKYRAADVAARVNGVILVDDNLEVQHAASSYIYDPYVDSWYITDYYGDQYRSIFPSKVDWEIKKDIENQLFWSPFVDADQVTVTVNDGEATLSGKVDSWSEYYAATENAYQGGAIYVDNELSVK